MCVLHLYMHVYIYIYAHIYMHVCRHMHIYVCTCIHAYIFYLLKGFRSTSSKVAVNTLCTKILISNTFSNERNQDSLEKWLNLGLGEGIHSMSLGVPYSARKQRNAER